MVASVSPTAMTMHANSKYRGVTIDLPSAFGGDWGLTLSAEATTAGRRDGPRSTQRSSHEV